MQNDDQHTGVVYPYGDASQASPSKAATENSTFNPEALSDMPTANFEPQASIPTTNRHSRTMSVLKWGAVCVAVLALIGGLIMSATKRETTKQAINIASGFKTVHVPLAELEVDVADLASAKTVTINGTLEVSDSLVLLPSLQPSSPEAGQLYYDKNTNLPTYFNGTEFIALTGSASVVQQIGGLTGLVGLGAGVGVSNEQLVNTGVLSVQGQTGAITLTAGPGIVIDGTTIRSSGLISAVSGSTNITVTNDGSGNITISSSSGSGSGSVGSPGGTAGRIARFSDSQTIADSLLSEDATTVTVNGDLSVTNSVAVAGNVIVTGSLSAASLSLGTALSVDSGGTGSISLAADGVLIGHGSGAITSVTAAGAGLCLQSTAGEPAFSACPGGGGGGVTTLNGLTGALTLANATGSVNTITIDNATNAAKGIASFDGVNFTVASGAVNTIQNISQSSSPTFAGLNTNTITPSGALSIGASTQSVTLLGDAGSVFRVGSVGQTTALGFSGVPTGVVNYNFDRAAAPGTYTICTTAANCSSGGTVSSAGGTIDRLSKFTGAQAIGDSSVTDNGSVVTITGTANLVVQGGTGTFGTLTQAGSLVISDGSSNTVSIVAANLGSDRIYTLPDAGGDATLCVTAGNCIGGTGGAPNGADYLVTSLSGTLTNERALTAGSNISFTDAGVNDNFTVATVQNPTFTTSVTTPQLQSSNALTISSGSGTVAIAAATTIELQDSTNVTGSLDVSVALNVGTGDAFAVNSSGAITAAAGIASSGTITFSGLDCTAFTNGGSLTTNGSGLLTCSNDDGGAGSSISGSGTVGTLPIFSAAQIIGDSIVTQTGTTIDIAGDLTLDTALTVANGGTGAGTFTTRGLLYGDGTNAVLATAAGTSGQVLIANASGVPTFATFSGDVAVSSTGATTIQANSVALGTDTTGDFIANLGALTGLSTGGNSGEASTPTLSVTYGSGASTSVQGNTTLTCPSGTGNLTGGGTSITLGTGGACGNISTVNNPTFTTSVTTPLLVLTGAGSAGTIQVANLGQPTTYTLPDPVGASTTICIATGNCSAAGTAGGDLTGTYPNPTIAKLQNTNLDIDTPTAGHILIYNGTNTAWENHIVSSDIVISETGVATIQANAAALGTDTTGNYVIGLTAGNGISVSGSAGEAWSPSVAVLYGSTANTAVQGDTSITVTAGTNLTGGGSITLGAGGTTTLNVSNSPIFSGTLVVQGATATIGGAAQAGSVVLNDGSTDTATINTAALADDRIYTLPDVGSNAEFCLNTGNCAGSGGGVTGSGTDDRVAKFTSTGSVIGDSSISDDGTTVTINGTANLVVQGGTGTFGTAALAGSLVVSDGSSDTVSIAVASLGDDYTYTIPDAGGDSTFCMSFGNCLGGGGGGAPNDAGYLLTSLNGTLTNERALTAGSNISFTDAGVNDTFTVATVQNPTFTTSVTTPLLQSSNALTISSGSGTVAVNAFTTIELQDSTNVTGSLDVSVALNVGTSDAFAVNASGAITAAAGVTSSGTITFSGLDCTAFANGGTITASGTGVLSCTDDNGAAAGTITGSGTVGTIPVFSGTQVIGDSIVTQTGTTIDIAGDLTLDTALTVANGGTGAATFTARGVLYGNGTGALSVTAAPTAGQVLIANASGIPTFATFTGDVAVSDTGATTIQANSVALGTDTVGNYVATLGTLTGLTTSGNTGEGSTPTLSVTYGSTASTAVQGNTTLTCPSGTGNLSGGGTSITLGTGGSCGNLSIINNPTFTTSVTTPQLILTGAGSNGTLVVSSLGQATTYTLPDPGAGGAADICISTGNCTAVGTAGGDLTGSYPNPTIAELQGTTLTINSAASGNILQFNGSAWVNHSVSGDITIANTGVATIANNAVTSGKINDGTIINGDLASGSFTNITGVGTLTGLTVTGATSINTSGTSNTAIGNSTGTLQLTSAGLNVSTAGALTGVAGIANSGSYTQTGTGANTFSGASTFTAAGTALSVTNNVTIGGTLTVNDIAPTGALTIGVDGQNFTLRGTSASTITATDTTSTTTVGFTTPTADTVINFPALPANTYTVCTSFGNCGGVGATLQTAYNNSTATEITLDATRAALTIRDNSTPLVGNLFEVQNNDGSTTYFNVTSSGINVTGGINASGGATLTNLSTAGIVTNTSGGVLGTVATVPVANGGTGAATLTANGILFGNGSSAIGATAAAANSVLVTNGSNVPSLSQTLPTAVQGNITSTGALIAGSIASGFGTIATSNNITTTALVQGGTGVFTGANAVTVGTTGTSTGAILFKGATAASGTITLFGQDNPTNNSLTLPNETGIICTTGSVCTGYAPSSGSGSYANTALSNLASVAINTALGFQSNQAANINFAAAAAAAGNAFNITGQAAGGTGNNGGDLTLQGGTATTTGQGGTTILRGGNAAATGTNGTLTLDAGSGATTANGTINLGNANASAINIGANNTLTSTIQIGATAQSAGTQTINIGNSNTSGGTTNVVIGAGSTATGGTTTVRAKGALTLTGGAASTWDAGGTLSLQTNTNSAITTGTGLWTQGGNVTFNGTTARTITGPSTGGLTVTVASGPLTLSTTGSGTLAVTSAGALNLTGAAPSTWTVGANTLGITSTNFNVSTGGVLNLVGGSAGFQIGSAATAGNFLRGNGTSFVSSALQSGDIPVCSGTCNYIANQTTQQTSANFNIVSAGAGSIGGFIQGATSSTASVLTLKGGATPGAGGDLLQAMNNSNTVALSVGSDGAFLSRNTADSSIAFRIQSAAGANQFLVNNNDNNSNLITNPSAEVNTTGWTGRTGSTVSRTTTSTDVYYGVGAVQSVNTATANAGVNYPIVLSPNTEYTIRVMLKMTVNGIVTFGYAADGSDETTWANTAGYGSNAGTSYYIVEKNFTTPGTVNGGAYIFLKQNDSTARTMYIDGLRAEVGSTNPMYREGQITIGSAATSVVIGGSPSNVPSNTDASLFVQQTRNTKGLVVRATPELDLFRPDAFQVQNGLGTKLLGVNSIFASTEIVGGNGFWNSAAMNINQLDLGGTGRGLMIQGTNDPGAAQQTGNLFEIASGTGGGRVNTNMVVVGGAGAATFRNYSNSTAGFQVQNALANSVLNVDTTNTALTVSSAAAASMFAAKVDYAADTNPRSVVSGDLDKDGDIDLVSVNTGDTSISVLLNSGTGTFAAKVDYTTGASPENAAIADLDKDGDMDIAVTNVGPDNVSIFINNGSGVFAAKVDYTTGTNPQKVSIADLDKDGDNDLAIASNTGNVMSVLLNSGTGTFAAKVDYATGTSPSGITTADLDKDGDIDAVVANNAADTVSVLLNSGTGTFAAKVDYAAGDAPDTVVSADLDKDGDIDVAVTNSTDNTVSVLMNNGSGVFAAKVDYATDTTPRRLVIADLDKDGDNDLATANEGSDTVSTLLNNGNGTFASKVSYTTADAPRGLIAADLDKDGDNDLASSNTNATSLSVLLNNTLAVSPTATPTLSLYSGGVNDVVQIRTSDEQRLFSIDARGNTTIGGEPSSANLFATHKDYATGLHPYGITSADFDKDGDNDLAVVLLNANAVSVFLNNGAGTFASYTNYTTGATPIAVTHADLDKDGDIDLAVTNEGPDSVSVFINNGSGVFAAKVDYTTASNPRGVAAADLDKDGDVDLVSANSGAASVSVLINNGSGVFAAKVDYTVGTSPYHITAADLDKDGDIDIATANGTTNNISVLLNNGSGVFAAKVDYTTDTGPTAINSADFDKDGDIDIATGNDTSISVFINNGSGVFAAKVDYTAPTGTQHMVVADFDKDSDIDIATANDNGPGGVTIFNNSGTGTFAAGVDYLVADFPIALTATDLDRDGDMDIAAASEDDFVSILLNNTLSGSRFKVLSGEGVTEFSIDSQNSIIQIGKTAAGLTLISGAATFQNASNSTTAFRILRDTASSSLPQFVVDTTNSRVYIGNPTSDTTGAVLVLDTKSDAGDPTTTGNVNGAMYYNGNVNKFRCFENSAWTDCILTAEYLRAEMRTPQLASNSETDLDDHLKYTHVQASAGSSISLDTASAYVEGGTGASIGRFTLTAGKTYKLSALIPYASFGTGFASTDYTWYNVTGSAQLGSTARAISVASAGQESGNGPAEAIVTPGSTMLVEVRLAAATSVTAIGYATAPQLLYPSAFIEVLK